MCKLPKRRCRPFAQWCFSHKGSTKRVIRGSANDHVALFSLHAMGWLHIVYSCDMFYKRQKALVAGSQDGLTVLRYPTPEFTWGEVMKVRSGGNNRLLPVLDVKTASESPSLDPLSLKISGDFKKRIHLASPDMTSCIPRDTKCS